jgi:hypothetical protein
MFACWRGLRCSPGGGLARTTNRRQLSIFARSVAVLTRHHGQLPLNFPGIPACRAKSANVGLMITALRSKAKRGGSMPPPPPVAPPEAALFCKSSLLQPFFADSVVLPSWRTQTNLRAAIWTAALIAVPRVIHHRPARPRTITGLQPRHPAASAR